MLFKDDEIGDDDTPFFECSSRTYVAIRQTICRTILQYLVMVVMVKVMVSSTEQCSSFKLCSQYSRK